jgi:hypothetical protein
MTLAAWTAALLLAVGAETAPVPPPPPGTPPPAALAVPARDPAALAVLKKMCDRMRQAKTFTFGARTTIELPVAGGSLATFSNGASVAVRRPDGLAATRGGDLTEFRFAYDGKTMTSFTPATGVWGTTAAPPTIAAMLVAAAEQGGLSFPFDELLVDDPYAAITDGVTEAVLVGPAVVDGKKTEHILLVSAGLRLELWIDPGTSLPARSLVVYADHPLRPHFGIQYSDWKIDPKLAASTFALPKPAGATQADFRVASSAFR